MAKSSKLNHRRHPRQRPSIEDSVISDLPKAAERGDVKRLQEILDREPARVNEQSVVNYPLHSALGQNQIRAAKLLIDRGADVNTKGLDGMTALHLCASHDSAKNEVARLLLDRGAYIEAVDRYGRTPLHFAAEEQIGGFRVARGLIRLLKARGAHYGIAPAALLGDAKRVREALVENPGAFRSLLPIMQEKLLVLVVDDPEVLKLLLESGANANSGNRNRRFLLHWVRNPESAELLLQHGAHVNALDNSDRTPLQIAEDPALREVLRRHGGKMRGTYRRSKRVRIQSHTAKRKKSQRTPLR
jgi:ankyrin repeat protein